MKGQDVGITCYFDNSIIQGNRVSEQGGTCIWVDAKNAIVSSNLTLSGRMINSNSQDGEITLRANAENVIVIDYICNGEDREYDRAGLSVVTFGTTKIPKNNSLIGNLTINHIATGDNAAGTRIDGMPVDTQMVGNYGNEAKQVHATGTNNPANLIDLQGDMNPTATAGIPAKQGSLYRTTSTAASGGAGLYVKDGPLKEDWIKV